MVVVQCQGIPSDALVKKLQENRVSRRHVGGKVASATADEKKAVADLKAVLACKNKNLVSLWFETLGLHWQKGGKQREKASLTDAIYADLSARGYDIDDANWVAYKVRKTKTFAKIFDQPF